MKLVKPLAALVALLPGHFAAARVRSSAGAPADADPRAESPPSLRALAAIEGPLEAADAAGVARPRGRLLQSCFRAPPVEVNVCFALDMSGSVCAPPGTSGAALFCTDCGCTDPPGTPDTCPCDGWANTTAFAESIVNDFDALSFGDAKYSVVRFGTGVTTDIATPVGKASAVPVLQDAEYNGGATNHGGAIEACQATLENDGVESIILLITDGVPTIDEDGDSCFGSFSQTSSCAEHGKDQATIAKDDGTFLRPIYIAESTSSETDAYLEDLSSDGVVNRALTFDDLEGIVDGLVGTVLECLPTISGKVWNDADEDGVREEGEDPIAGATISVYNSSDTLIGTVTTDANGDWSMDLPVLGSYYAVITPPPTFELTIKNTTIEDGSDFDPTTFRTDVQDLTTSGAEAVVDAGLFTKPTPPGGHDDPHFATLKGERYDYHGQCDLIYTTCPSFDNNKGLRIHIRTKHVEPQNWSTITNLAVKIGKDEFELQSDGTYRINSEVNPAISDTTNLAGHGMKLQTYDHHHPWWQTGGSFKDGNKFSIALDNGLSLDVTQFSKTLKSNEIRKSLAFKFSGVHEHRDNGGTSLLDCVGLSSTWDHPEGDRFLVGRSGTTYPRTDNPSFGKEWQVDFTKGDPMLFAEDIGQQLPDQSCVDGVKDIKRRQLEGTPEGDAVVRQAEDACRHLKGGNKHTFEACVYDVIVTGDVSFAEDPWYNDEF